MSILSTKCYQAKAGELNRQWYVIDASDQVVGRLAAQIAPILMGKHRPTYTPYLDTGDCVIVTNVDKVVFTGKKWEQKSYQRYSGYPGGQREETAWKLFQRRPARILELAIQRMMPKNKIARHMMGKLYLVVGPQHPHQAQQPIPLEAIHGRPASAGILFAPTPKVGPRKPRPRKGSPAPAAPREEVVEETFATEVVAPEVGATATAPTASEASLPAPDTESALPSPGDVEPEPNPSAE